MTLTRVQTWALAAVFIVPSVLLANAQDPKPDASIGGSEAAPAPSAPPESAFFYQEPVTPQRAIEDSREYLQRNNRDDLLETTQRAEQGDAEAIETLLERFDSASTPQELQRTASAIIASGRQSSDVQQRIAKRIEQGDVPAAVAAALAISWGPDADQWLPTMEPYLRRDLADDPLRFHDVYWALRVLTTAREGAEDYEAEVRELAGHANTSIRRNAIYSLGAMGSKLSEDGKELVLGALSDGNFTVRQAAIISAINLARQLTPAEQQRVLEIEPWPVRAESEPLRSEADLTQHVHMIELAVARAIFKDDPEVIVEVYRRAPSEVVRSTSLTLLAQYIVWLGEQADQLVPLLTELTESSDAEFRDVGLYLADHLEPKLRQQVLPGQ